ncbi:MAG: hypothetical protein KGJ60_00720 [Verrucomicrobiota bacterium]|nr:hypothetical protein [Verrucomicrobiota bacterium]MDE3066050.1 hypothetical protein [Verrucomicrobiota bacterium]
MPRSPADPLTRDRAWACVTLNFSISGWGSLKAGRTFAGSCQLAAVFAGFFLLSAWMIEWLNRIFQAESWAALPPRPPAWLWEWGVVCFAVSYSWMLITCVSLMRQAKRQEDQKRQNMPPRLADLPGKPPKLSS